MISRFEYFNPNPKAKFDKNGKPKKWHLGDCSIRAICAATGMTWVEAYRFATESALKVFDPFNCTTGFSQVMEDLGFVKVSYMRGEKREKVNEFAKNHEGETAILSLAGHYVCCKEGKFWDTFDCGNATAYNYWIKK